MRVTAHPLQLPPPSSSSPFSRLSLSTRCCHGKLTQLQFGCHLCFDFLVLCDPQASETTDKQPHNVCSVVGFHISFMGGWWCVSCQQRYLMSFLLFFLSISRSSDVVVPLCLCLLAYFCSFLCIVYSSTAPVCIGVSFTTASFHFPFITRSGDPQSPHLFILATSVALSGCCCGVSALHLPEITWQSNHRPHCDSCLL